VIANTSVEFPGCQTTAFESCAQSRTDSGHSGRAFRRASCLHARSADRASR